MPLYGAKGGAATTSDLYTIDPATAAATPLFALGHSLTGLAIDPTNPNLLYGLTRSNSAADPRSLIVVDLVTEAVTVIGVLGLTPFQTCTDIAFDSTGNLFGWSSSSHALVSIDKATAAASYVGALTDGKGGLSFNSSDVLYHLPQNNADGPINTVDTSTGAETTIATLGNGPESSDSDLLSAAFDEADVLYALWRVFPSTTYLVTVDIATGVVTDIGVTTVDMDGLAWSPVDGGATPASMGGVRVGIAFDDPTLEPDPTWTYLTDTASLVASYEIDRGRQFEFDRTDTGTATVRVNDRDGILDPTNSTGPYYTLIEPLLQIQLELWNPITEDFHVRFRGFIEDFDYVVAPFTHQEGSETVGVTYLQIGCVDLFAILTAIEMQPGEFGDTPPAGAEGDVFFDNAAANDRIEQVLTNAGIDPAFYVVFTLNVNMPESTYSPSENVLQVIQEAADAEFPTVSNVYTDRYGRLAVHGRLAKFDPEGTASDAGTDAWDYHHWQCGDGKAVALSPTDTAQFREFAFNRGLSKIFNSALCTPEGIDDPPTVPGVSDIPGQLAKDLTSIGIYGIRSWSAENLRIESGILTGNNALEECLLFATFIKANYASPRNRISTLTFKSMHPDWTGAAATWELLCKSDISDSIDVTISIPGTGGFNLEPGFIEGIHETATPLNGEYAMVTQSLDVSPRAYFDNPEGLDGV